MRIDLAPKARRGRCGARGRVPAHLSAHLRALLAACCAAGASTASAQSAGPGADAARPWSVTLSQSLAHDSNLLRLSDGASAPAGVAKDDTLSTTGAAAQLNADAGRQRASLALDARHVRFRDNRRYDHDAWRAAAALDWATLARLSGTVGVSHSEALSPFNARGVGLLTERNLERVRRVDGSASLGGPAALALEARAWRRELSNSLALPAVQARDNTQDSASLGVSWRYSPALLVGLAGRRVQGEYPRFRTRPDGSVERDRFDADHIDARLLLQPTAASSVQARASVVETRYEARGADGSSRDDRGFTGRLVWDWQATGKTRSTLRVLRERGRDSVAFAGADEPGVDDDTSRTTFADWRVAHALSAKVALDVAGTWIRRDLQRTRQGASAGALTSTGRETDLRVELGLGWAPWRSTRLQCSGAREWREGEGELGNDLTATRYGCTLQFVID